MFVPWKITSPSVRQPGIRSFIRLNERSTVLLPQPEGPMIAVILWRENLMFASLIALETPVKNVDVLAICYGRRFARFSRRRPQDRSLCFSGSSEHPHFSAVPVAQKDGGSVEGEEQNEQHHDRRGGRVPELRLRPCGPLVDLYRQGGELGKNGLWVESHKSRRSDDHQRRGLADGPRDREDRAR